MLMTVKCSVNKKYSLGGSQPAGPIPNLFYGLIYSYLQYIFSISIVYINDFPSFYLAAFKSFLLIFSI